MAGARPQRRAGGLSGIHVWLIVFVALWLASTTALILLYTGQEQLRNERDSALKRLAAVASPAELGQPAIQAMQTLGTSTQPPRTLVGVMYDTIKSLTGRLTGNPDDEFRAAETTWLALADEIGSERRVPNPDQIGRGAGLIPALRQMYEWYVAESDGRQQTAGNLEAATRNLEEAENRNRTLEEEFAARLDELDRKVQSIAADKDEFARLKTGEIDDLQKNIAAKRDELSTLTVSMERARQTHETELGRVQQTLAEQARVLADYRSPGPEGTNELDMARQPVGRILRALPGDSLVHIDLGRLDGVRLGMPFAVYAFDKKVPPDGRGKATIEAVSVGPHTAECRVVTPPPPDDPILEEDRVGNILLSRNRTRKQRFVVVGSFDVDYDGQDDPLGYDKVVAFIERFGGEIVAQVDATTDYVVVGRRPAASAADAARGAARDPTAPTAARRAAHDAAAYDESVQQAMLLAVPRLRQDQFFNFVGLELGRDVATRLLP